MVTLSKSFLNVRPQISPNIHVFHSGLKCSSYKHLFNSGPPSARQRCWRRRQPRRVGVVGKMWRSGGENEGSIDILDFEYFRYFFTNILFIYFSGEHRDDRDHRERRRSRSRERRRRSRSRSRERHRRQDCFTYFVQKVPRMMTLAMRMFFNWRCRRRSRSRSRHRRHHKRSRSRGERR